MPEYVFNTRELVGFLVKLDVRNLEQCRRLLIRHRHLLSIPISTTFEKEIHNIVASAQNDDLGHAFNIFQLSREIGIDEACKIYAPAIRARRLSDLCDAFSREPDWQFAYQVIDANSSTCLDGELEELLRRRAVRLLEYADFLKAARNEGIEAAGLARGLSPTATNILKLLLRAYRLVSAAIAKSHTDYLEIVESIRLLSEALDEIDTDEHSELRLELLGMRADRLTLAGERDGNLGAIMQACVGYQAVLQSYEGSQFDDEWAKIQNNLGNALSIIGELDSDDVALRASLTHYGLALEHRAMAGFSREWADVMT